MLPASNMDSALSHRTSKATEFRAGTHVSSMPTSLGLVNKGRTPMMSATSLSPSLGNAKFCMVRTQYPRCRALPSVGALISQNLLPGAPKSGLALPDDVSRHALPGRTSLLAGLFEANLGPAAESQVVA